MKVSRHRNRPLLRIKTFKMNPQIGLIIFSFEYLAVIQIVEQLTKWKGINIKQSTRWQRLSWLKASAFFSLQNFFSNLYLGLVLPSGGWQSLIEKHLFSNSEKFNLCVKAIRYQNQLYLGIKTFYLRLWKGLKKFFLYSHW